MTQSKHTQGEWTIVEDDGRYAIKAGDEYVCHGGCGCCNSYDQSIANEHDAILIAAAPQLLAALQMIVQLNPELPMGCIEDAESAIAKATGETQ